AGSGAEYMEQPVWESYGDPISDGRCGSSGGVAGTLTSASGTEFSAVHVRLCLSTGAGDGNSCRHAVDELCASVSGIQFLSDYCISDTGGSIVSFSGGAASGADGDSAGAWIYTGNGSEIVFDGGFWNFLSRQSSGDFVCHPVYMVTAAGIVHNLEGCDGGD